MHFLLVVAKWARKWILQWHSKQIKAVLEENNEPQKLEPTKFSMLIKEKNKKINFFFTVQEQNLW